MSHVLVICARRYNGHELWMLLGTLHNKGHTFEVVSTELIVKDELTFQPNSLKRTVYDVKDTDSAAFDAISVVSGNMKDTEAYWTDKHIHNLLLSFRREKKVTSAICCSVPTLSPIVQGIKVSYFPLIRSRQRLERAGAILQPVSLTVDKMTVTAENQMLSQQWSEEICNLLSNKDNPPLYSFKDSGFSPKGHERHMPKDIQAAITQAKNEN